jgi:hypothetical protein
VRGGGGSAAHVTFHMMSSICARMRGCFRESMALSAGCRPQGSGVTDDAPRVLPRLQEEMELRLACAPGCPPLPTRDLQMDRDPGIENRLDVRDPRQYIWLDGGDRAYDGETNAS